MASQWYSLISQKLYLAQVLLRQLDQAEQCALTSGQPPAILKEAETQAIAEMLLRARDILLVMIARCHQQKTATPRTLQELKSLLPYEAQEVAALEVIATEPDSWWSHLEQLDRALGQPPVTKKTVSAENIIAIATENGPDRCSGALEKTRAAMTLFARELEERHSEW